MRLKQIGEIWKEDRKWKVQFPKGIMSFKIKRIALEAKRLFCQSIKEEK